MLKKAEKILLQKLTKAVGIKLQRLNSRWTDIEISEVSKVPTPRLSEYKNFDKYGRAINMNNFVRLLFGGFFTVDEIIEVAEGLTEEEIKHLRNQNFFENAGFRTLLIQNKEMGIDPVELQSLVHELKKNGVDPIKALRSLKDNA